MVRPALLSIAIVAALMLRAEAAEPSVSARIAPETPRPAPALPPSSSFLEQQQPTFVCDDTYCGVTLLRDLWKRDALKPETQDDINANAIYVARAGFGADVERFGDPHAPPPLLVLRIPHTSCALYGLILFSCRF